MPCALRLTPTVCIYIMNPAKGQNHIQKRLSMRKPRWYDSTKNEKQSPINLPFLPEVMPRETE